MFGILRAVFGPAWKAFGGWFSAGATAASAMIARWLGRKKPIAGGSRTKFVNAMTPRIRGVLIGIASGAFGLIAGFFLLIGLTPVARAVIRLGDSVLDILEVTARYLPYVAIGAAVYFIYRRFK